MIIPFDALSQEALQGIVEEFINREGTDYGLYEMSIGDKVEQLLEQIRTKKAVIAFDSATETTNILTVEDYQQLYSVLPE